MQPSVSSEYFVSVRTQWREIHQILVDDAVRAKDEVIRFWRSRGHGQGQGQYKVRHVHNWDNWAMDNCLAVLLPILPATDTSYELRMVSIQRNARHFLTQMTREKYATTASIPAFCPSRQLRSLRTFLALVALDGNGALTRRPRYKATHGQQSWLTAK